MIGRMQFRIAFIGFFFALNTSLLSAQGVSPTWGLEYQSAAQKRIDAGEAYAVVEELLILSPIHAGDFEFDYFFGVAALKAQRYPLALDALERVVLTRPQHAGAWLDLAIVYQHLGQTEAALSIIDHVQQNFAPSPELSAQLQQIKSQLNRNALTQNWRVEVSAHLGRVTNANSGLNELSLVLTPSGGTPIPVEIASSLRARPSTVLLGRASATKAFTDADARQHEVFVSAGTRRFFSEQQSNQSDVNLFWSVSQRLNDAWRLNVGPGLRMIDQGEQGSVAIGSVYAAFTTRINDCVYGARVEPEWRNYNRADIVSSQTVWVGPTVRCLAPGGLQWMGGLRFGLDDPSGARAGGETRRWELSLQLRKLVTPELAFDVGALLGAYRDQDGYSSLIADGERRWVDRSVLRIGAEWSLATKGINDMYVTTHYDYIQDQSNIAFSRLKDRQFFLGGRYELK